MRLPADVTPLKQVVFDPECRSCLFFGSCHFAPPISQCITIVAPENPCAVGLSAADGPRCLCTGSACGHPFSERGKSRKSLSRPALRGGVVRAGALATPALYPARFSTGVAPRPGLRIPRFRVGTKARNRRGRLRVGMGRIPPHGPHAAFLIGGGVRARPAPEKPTRGRTGGNAGRCASTALFVSSLY